MPVKPSIEIVVNDNGVLRQCFAINEKGERVVELNVKEYREQFNPNEPGVSSIDIHTFRVKRTQEGIGDPEADDELSEADDELSEADRDGLEAMRP